VIRPDEFTERRVERVQELFPLVEGAAVEIRGWDFPHIDRTTQPHVDVDWVGQESVWEHALESWRLYMSGQFVDVVGFPNDWRDQSTVWPAGPNWEPGQEFGVGEAVYKLTEIVEFAARLSLSSVGDERMYLGVTAAGLGGRLLVVDDPMKMPFAHEYRCGIDELPLERVLDRDHLVAEPLEVALELATEVFARFHWNTGHEVLTGFLRTL
jgi:hypothetical protein